MKIRIGLFGFGKAGKVVAKSLYDDDRFELVFAVKNYRQKKTNGEFEFLVESKESIGELIDYFNPEIIVDLTAPDAVMQNVKKLQKQTGYVIATTGFKESQLKSLKEHLSLKILYAPNISDGINALIKACEAISNVWKSAEAEVIEQHFKSKKDAPSGTAKRIAKVFGTEIPIHSVRLGEIVSVHEVVLAHNNQVITLKHESLSRDVFAQGIKKAALWLTDKECGFYHIDDVYN